MEKQVNYFNATHPITGLWTGHIIGDPDKITQTLTRRGYTKIGHVPFLFVGE